jgi:hypothetical protein
LVPLNAALCRFAYRKFFCGKEMAMAWESKRCERSADPETRVEAQNGRFSGNAVLYAQRLENEEAGNKGCEKQSACVRLRPRISRNIIFLKSGRNAGIRRHIANCRVASGETTKPKMSKEIPKLKTGKRRLTPLNAAYFLKWLRERTKRAQVTETTGKRALRLQLCTSPEKLDTEMSVIFIG